MAGFEITPAALVVAPLATKSKVVEARHGCGHLDYYERSPYIVRTSFTVPQSCVIIADWAAKNNMRKVRHDRLRLRSRLRCRAIVHRALQRTRPGTVGRSDQDAARQSGFLANPGPRRHLQA